MTNEELVSQIQNKDNPAASMALLYDQNRGFLHQIAARYQAYESIEDLEQEAFLGLYKAVEGYEPDKGHKFLTYAEYWVRQAVQRYIENNGSCIRIPSYSRQRLIKYRKFCSSFQQEYGRKPLREEISSFLGVSLKMLEDIEKDALRGDLDSLDRGIGEDGSRISLGDTVQGAAGVEDGILDDMYMEQMKKDIWEVVDTLQEEQAHIIRQRFQEGKTLKELGEERGGSLESVRTIESKALRELRKPSRSRRLKPYCDELLEVSAYRRRSVETFHRTFTSQTEYAAIMRG